MWIAIIAIIGFIVCKISRESNNDVELNVTKYGGMLKKYSILVNYLQNAGLSIIKVTKDSVILGNGNAIWSLDYVANNLEVRVKGEVPYLGLQSHVWSFPNGYPQRSMIESIESYIRGMVEQQNQIRNYY